MTKQFISTPLTPELKCSDFDVSLYFYTNVLGFNIQYQRPEDGFAMLERQGSRLMLDEIRLISVTKTDRTWISGPLEPPFGRGINLQMETDHVDGLYTTVQKAGARIFLPMEEKWYRRDDEYLGNRQFIVMDPDGYLLRFFEDLGVRKDS
jgi:catechol 2,3-dioxygenase-like lactoylglutathione lyase family enzyme